MRAQSVWEWGVVMAAVILSARPALGTDRTFGPHFKYAGGTEDIRPACDGNLELSSTEMTFHCSAGSATIPYTSISLMQYRPDVSSHVRKMKLKCKVPLPHGGGKRNKYFTVLYDLQGSKHVIVLHVPPADMRPYLAEIDLKSGKRVEVKSFEEYD